MCDIVKMVIYNPSRYREIDKICNKYIYQIIDVINKFEYKVKNLDCKIIKKKIEKLNIKKFLYFKIKKEIETNGIEYMISLLYIYPECLFVSSYKKRMFDHILNSLVIYIINHFKIKIYIKEKTI